MTIPRSEIRSLVRGVYKIQKLRVQIGLRVVATFKNQIGQAPSVPETDLDSAGQKMLNNLRKDYKRLTDGVVRLPTKKAIEKDKGLISNYAMFSLIHQYEQILESEEQQFLMLKHTLSYCPIYTNFLLNVKGIGPAIAGVIISELDIHKSKYVSCIWKYLGLDVAPDGRGRGKYKDHLVDKEYTDSNGKVTKTKGISHNAWAKSKILYIGGGSLIKAKDYYYKVYMNYKHRLNNRPDLKNHTDGHKHAMAMRYMVKIFLSDLYEAWRKLEGLELHDPYHVAKLGMKEHKAA